VDSVQYLGEGFVKLVGGDVSFQSNYQVVVAPVIEVLVLGGAFQVQLRPGSSKSRNIDVAGSSRSPNSLVSVMLLI
jgi:hypothetical protein